MANFLLREGIRGMFMIDTEKENFDVIDYSTSNIDWIYEAPEDGQVTLKDRDNKVITTKSVKKGNLIIQFYNHDGVKNRVIVIDNPEWKENIDGSREAAIERAKKFAENNKCNETIPCEAEASN